MEKRCPVGAGHDGEGQAGHDGEGQAGHDDDDSTVMADLIGHLVNEVGYFSERMVGQERHQAVRGQEAHLGERAVQV